MSPKCKSCGAPITWAQTDKGRAIPIDAQKDLAGNITLVKVEPGGEGGAGGLRAIVGAPGSGHYVSHFSTCPNAGKHRKRGAETHGVRR